MDFVEGKGFILSEDELNAMRAANVPADGSVFAIDKPSLGAPSTVDSILRNIFSMIADGRAAELKGDKGRTEIVRGIEGACSAAQDILYGRDDSYAITPWNSPDHLGAYLVNVVGIGGDTADAVFRVLSNFVTEAVRIVAAHESDRITESGMEAAVDGVLETYGRLLMGLPPE